MEHRFPPRFPIRDREFTGCWPVDNATICPMRGRTVEVSWLFLSPAPILHRPQRSALPHFPRIVAGSTRAKFAISCAWSLPNWPAFRSVNASSKMNFARCRHAVCLRPVVSTKRPSPHCWAKKPHGFSPLLAMQAHKFAIAPKSPQLVSRRCRPRCRS